jgi:hypothetical protein
LFCAKAAVAAKPSRTVAKAMDLIMSGLPKFAEGLSHDLARLRS